jgi:predicted RNA-binding protein
MSKKTRGIVWEVLSEVVLITSTIYLSTLFVNDTLFNSRIKERPTLFAWVAFGGIVLAVLTRLLAKKYQEAKE